MDFRMDQRTSRAGFVPQDLKLNTAGAFEHSDNGMYVFQGARSPMSATTTLFSPTTLQTPIEPNSASSSASNQSIQSIKARQTRKQPSSRPAAKRMRDTRDREGVAIQQMETDLEAEGCLADLKPLNANNKEEAGRRYPKADVLERYCTLADKRSRKLKREAQKAMLDSRKCQAYQKWFERWSSTLNKDALEQLDAMISEVAPTDRHFDSGVSFSTRSSISEYDRRSPSSGDWSAEDHDLVTSAVVPHRHPSEQFAVTRV